jgi:5-methylcytosine-specific restriction endonuclease McrA
MLQEYAGLRFYYPAAQYDRVRRTAWRSRFWTMRGPCWVCRSAPPYHDHHIIQIQHGGTNEKMNRVGLCYDCHREVHPWM